ncbi:MAG: fibrobacter succinogenes major paralogous domain-containing protein [Candidatus Falkowbacteria bacterium]|nr:fibrobacter succinogenes major paralogous domain-containing protein [Candidatus Falkowbacteria bacterium]
MKLSKYIQFLNSKKGLVILLALFAFAATYASAVGVNKNPNIGVMVPVNDYEPAWYINPGTKEKIVLTEPLSALRVMKKFGVGIKHSTLHKYLKSGFPKNLAGKVLLDVEARGQAYYVSALDLSGHFLGQPNFALLVFRENGFRLSKDKSNIKLNNPLAEERQKTTPQDNAVVVEDNKSVVEIKDIILNNLTITTQPIKKSDGFSKIKEVAATITNENNLIISEKGFVWGLSPNPSLEENIGVIKSLDEGNNFVANIDDIKADATYYVKAYALAEGKTFYGNEEKFIMYKPAAGGSAPTVVLPSVSTAALSITGVSSLSSGGIISNDGFGQITSKGICWSTSNNPTLNDSCSNEGGGKAEFTSSVTVSDPEAIYYVRSYATNSAGTTYGNEVMTCGATTVNDTEDNLYNVVKIGSQCWMKENLKIGTFVQSKVTAPCTDYQSPGDPLTHYWSCQNDDTKIEKYCFGNNVANCATDGGLYEWQEAMALPASCVNSDCSAQITSPHQGICPTGWHIPTDAELSTLEQRTVEKIASPNTQYPCGAFSNYDTYWHKRCADDNGTQQGGSHGAGKSLKAVGQGSGNGAGDDLVGFSLLLNGYRRWDNGVIFGKNNIADIWASEQTYFSGDPFYAWTREWTLDSSTITRDRGIKSYGLNVRCIKD